MEQKQFFKPVETPVEPEEKREEPHPAYQRLARGS